MVKILRVVARVPAQGANWFVYRNPACIIQEKTLIKNSHWETHKPNEDNIFAIENLFQQLGIFYNCFHCKN